MVAARQDGLKDLGGGQKFSVNILRIIAHSLNWQLLCRWLGTPKLVRETSRRHWWQRSKTGEKTSEEVKRDFSDIVLPGGLQDHVRALAAVTANTRLHGAPFRHLLFYGPPGDSPDL